MTRLLLVEDDIALVRTLAISLEARGFEVTATTHGNKAIALARANPRTSRSSTSVYPTRTESTWYGHCGHGRRCPS